MSFAILRAITRKKTTKLVILKIIKDKLKQKNKKSQVTVSSPKGEKRGINKKRGQRTNKTKQNKIW